MVLNIFKEITKITKSVEDDQEFVENFSKSRCGTVVLQISVSSSGPSIMSNSKKLFMFVSFFFHVISPITFINCSIMKKLYLTKEDLANTKQNGVTLPYQVSLLASCCKCTSKKGLLSEKIHALHTPAATNSHTKMKFSMSMPKSFTCNKRVSMIF